MAKATITFTLPEEQTDFHDAVHASDYKMILWDLDQKLRSEIKYNEKLDHKTELAYQNVRDMILGLLNDYGVSHERRPPAGIGRAGAPAADLLVPLPDRLGARAGAGAAACFPR